MGLLFAAIALLSLAHWQAESEGIGDSGFASPLRTICHWPSRF